MSYDQHPLGWHQAEVTEHTISESFKNKTPFVWMLFKTKYGEVENRYYLTPKAIKMLKNALLALEYEGDSVVDFAETQCLVGKKCFIHVVEDASGRSHKRKISSLRHANDDPSLAAQRPEYVKDAVEKAKELNSRLFGVAGDNSSDMETF